MHNYKKEMDARVAVLKEQIKGLQNERKTLSTPAEKTLLDKKIQIKRNQTKLYDTKKVDLRKTGEFILNMKLYSEFLKKIKGMYYLIQVGELGIEVHYGKTHELKAGKLVFYNLSEHYSEFAGIPALEEVIEVGQIQIA